VLTTILLFSSISASFGLGGGVGLGFRIGAGGGAPSCGQCAGRGQSAQPELQLAVAMAWPMQSQSGGDANQVVARLKRHNQEGNRHERQPKRKTTARRPENDWCFSNLITTKPSLNKCAMSNHFREQERYFSRV